MGNGNKKPGKKRRSRAVWADAHAPWSVVFGELRASRGRPAGAHRLFKVLGEKLPYDSLDDVEAAMDEEGLSKSGIYMAHDSMGFVRYVGRGHVFNRLRTHRDLHSLELLYFSFFIVEERNHVRELETMLIRAASPLLFFNARKKRTGIGTGNIRDYEPQTRFFERQYKKGPKGKTRSS